MLGKRLLICTFRALLSASVLNAAGITDKTARPSPKWVTDGIVYQIQPRTFTAEGTLAAATKKLAYLKDLGVTIVYSTPVFVMDTDTDPAHWSKRQAEAGNPKNPYRIADFNHVDPEFGTDADLKAFTAEAHRLGLKVLFDLVYYHCGPKAVFLKDHPDWVMRKPDGSMDCGDWRFPKLNFKSRGLRDYLLDNMRRLIVDFGADGFRCDIGEMLPIDFWEESRDLLEKLAPNRYALVCEGCSQPDQVKAFDVDYGWFPGGELAEGTMVIGTSDFDGCDMAKKIGETYNWHRNCFVRGAKFMYFVESHDIAQNESRARRNRRWSKGAQEAALVWIFTQDGLPMLFHGHEFGASEPFSNFVRKPIEWERAETPEGRARLAFVKKLIALRRQYPALTAASGVGVGLIPLKVETKGVTAILRRAPGCRDVLVVQNWTDQPVDATIAPQGAFAGRSVKLESYGWLVEEQSDLVVFDGPAKRWGEKPLEFKGPWDLRSHGTLRIDVENTSTDAEVCLMVDFGGQDDSRVRMKMIPAGFKGTIDIDVCPPPAKPDVAAKMKLMRTDPFMNGDRDKPYDAARIGKIVLGHHWGGKSTAPGGVVPEVIVKSVVALDTSKKTWPAWYAMDAKTFFPFIDRYGQFVHGTWPNKVTDDAALKTAAKEESADLATHPGPDGWDRFGGWAKGPQLEATGRFRVVKKDGKWWFVDPDGHLWWSHGSVRVTPSSAVTPLDGREDYFADLPADDAKDPFGAFYHTYDELLKPYYDKKGWERTYDFSAANLCRKYGADWRATYADLSHRRLRSWGLNTIANSSDAGIRKMDRTPWIERLETRGPRCKEQKNEGHWWHVPDPYSPEFRNYLRGQLESRRAELCSPWCVGIFVDNEHNWGGISDKTVREYFKVIREEIKRLDPKLLYFGCRFAGAGPWHDRIAKICAEYADVVSFNIYDFRIDGFVLPEGVDKPVLIGEFHFGATSDTGLFNPSLIPVADQKARAAAYGRYVRDALEHPLIVGTHWHQFSDQPTTGRFDGENFNVGFTDVCDTPYDAMRAALREIGADLYGIRARSPRRLSPALKLGVPFRDLMVLQRDKPVAIFGEADPAAEITVRFAGQCMKGTADAKGYWIVRLAPMPASSENREMTVTATPQSNNPTIQQSNNPTIQQSNNQTIRNVLVGEVWLASGQSNMEMRMAPGSPCYRDRQGGLLTQLERHDAVRVGGAWGTFHVPTNRCGFCWSRMDSAYSIQGTSALAFYYARELNRLTGVPVGMLCVSCGGTGIDEWTPKSAFAKYPSLADLASRKIYSQAEWKKEYAKPPVWNYWFQPTIYFNGGINPLAPYTVRGLIWYQGCANQDYADRYADNLRALYDGWSAAFENPEMRMDLVQLAPHNNPKIVKLWRAQDEFARDPAYSNRVSRTVINDQGNPAEIHPEDKELVARRLLLHALKRDYGFKDITADSPEAIAVKPTTNGTLAVTFSNAKWLYYRNHARKIAENAFELAGEDGVWKPALFVNAKGRNGWGHEDEGRFPANVVELKADGVAAPVRVRYLANAPWEGGLFSEVDLPAPAFEYGLKD